MKCKICGKEKDITEFKKAKDYISHRCNECERIRAKEYANKNREKIKQYKKLYYEENKEKIKEYINKNEEHYKQIRRKYRQNNKEKIDKYMKDYREKNKDKINEVAKKYREKRKKEDYIFKFKTKIRALILNSFKRRNKTKSESTEKILGCSLDYFIEHLFKTYKNNYGVEWDEKEKVHIDHIIPLATVKTEEEVIKLNHYTNLQLLKAKDNLKKGSKT